MEFIRKVNPKDFKEIMINIEDAIELINEGEAILVDVREEFETKVWSVNFATQIPASKLPDNLEKLPKDKVIITACPTNNRSNASAMYLISQGYDARFLVDGLIKLMEYLKGGNATAIKM